MELYSVFVTGANRGIGLGFVKAFLQFPKPPEYVFATYRSATGIQDLENIRDSSKKSKVVLIKMDVTNTDEIENARKIVSGMVGDKGLTLLVNNAGVFVGESFPKISKENLLFHFKTNTIGPIMVVQGLLPLLEQAASVNGSGPTMRVNRAGVLNISSFFGSNVENIPEFEEGILLYPSYCISKASLNRAMRSIAASVKSKGILVFMICPGWVKTDMGTSEAQLEVSESVSAILNTLPKLTEEHHGTFMFRNGDPARF